jgi:hypothetical protein
MIQGERRWSDCFIAQLGNWQLAYKLWKIGSRKTAEINYALMGNANPILHAHIVPRYLDEPEDLRKQPPWFYPNIRE